MTYQQGTARPHHVGILGSRGFPSTYGGYETLVRYLARAWVEQGLEVTVYCRTKKDEHIHWEDEGVQCRWVPSFDTKSLSTLTFGLSSHLDASFQKLDAALVLNIGNGFFLPLLKLAGVPTVVNTDGIEWERGKWGRMARGMFFAGAKLTARFADVLVADSEAIAAIWRDTFGVNSVFIPYGAPVLAGGVGDERIHALGLVPRTYALVVARLIPENNVDLMLDALEQLRPAVPAVVVGSANYDLPIEQRLRDLDHRGLVRWLGHVSDQELLTQLWANAGVYLHGHSVGGTNPALLQALGAGSPTLALATNFNREVISDEGMLFPPDPDRLATMIRKVVDDVECQGRMTAKGQQTIADRYDWDDVCGRYYEALCLAYRHHS